MHSITIALRENPSVWTLLFNNKESAEAAWKLLNDPVTEITDDYGQTILLEANTVAGALMEDMEMSKLAHIARALHNAKTNAAAHQRAQADPVLRTSMMTHGPAVLSSAVNGGRI